MFKSIWKALQQSCESQALNQALEDKAELSGDITQRPKQVYWQEDFKRKKFALVILVCITVNIVGRINKTTI